MPMTSRTTSGAAAGKRPKTGMSAAPRLPAGVAYTVGEVASLSGITVRTLHHYDDVELLHPSDRSPAGYRLYTAADLERLQEILFFRELGFSLAEIGRVLDTSSYSRARALTEQRRLLVQKAQHVRAMIDSIDRAITAHNEGDTMNADDMFDVFGDFDPTEYEAEAEERWGDTDAWRESGRRTSQYGKDDWQAIKDEGDAISREFAAVLAAGEPADSNVAMDIAERHRLYIDRWFYSLDHEQHANLATMYVADPRFAETWNRYGDGVAEFVSDAIVANGLRASA